ncbi:MAG: hypothetical protein ACI828_001791 [Flavobacteriales bacterium]|jgi:hypothetical protein
MVEKAGIMKKMILVILLCGTHYLWGQRASYGNERRNTAQMSNILTEPVPLEAFVALLKLDTIQQERVRFILTNQKLRPIKGQAAASPKGLSYEGRRELFEKHMQAVRNAKLYLQFKSVQ